jgi:N6-L-threonylcarbamoyladenine synthase
MIVLGIETSCDETSAAVLVDGRVMSNIISSQMVHTQFGGVVPELASRVHQRLIVRVIDEALKSAGVTKRQLGGIAATHGPGLVGALLVGLNFAKAMAYGLQVPFVGVNHIEGHLYSNFLNDVPPSYPYVALIVSGGHTMLIHVRAPFDHDVLGQTRDDAAGEAFDKVAKMLGLGYPGGPLIDKLAQQGDSRAIHFPRSYLQDGSYEFSFSGIKTAVLYYLRHLALPNGCPPQNALTPGHMANICASFQTAVVDVLVAKTVHAARALHVNEVTLAGGVSANSLLRARMEIEAVRNGYKLSYPPAEYCMDNGAMIAFVGWMKLQRGLPSNLELPAVANLAL